MNAYADTIYLLLSLATSLFVTILLCGWVYAVWVEIQEEREALEDEWSQSDTTS